MIVQDSSSENVPLSSLLGESSQELVFALADDTRASHQAQGQSNRGSEKWKQDDETAGRYPVSGRFERRPHFQWTDHFPRRPRAAVAPLTDSWVPWARACRPYHLPRVSTDIQCPGSRSKDAVNLYKAPTMSTRTAIRKP